MQYWIPAATLTALLISLFATRLAGTIALRIGMVDVPGRHKAHGRVVPLLGGSAIFLAVLLPSLLALAMASIWSASGVPAWVPESLAIHVPGAARMAPRALIILGMAALLHGVGLVDDRKHLGPWVKLAVQFAAAAVVVFFCNVRVLTVAPTWVSITASLVWVVVITNAFNFLDNMDGLSAGIASICAAALLASSAAMGQVFVSSLLCVLLGATLGFLPRNFPPAKIFMGDGGSLVIGFLLGVASALTTYVRPGETYYLYGVFVPLVVMAVPLYDMVSVITLRLRERRNPMVGDRRHFSHRLLRRGMNVRRAVLTIYLCTLTTALSASLLPHVTDNIGAVLVFAQTFAVLMVIAVLESGNVK